MKREIIFDMPTTYGIYRVVCRFGYDIHVNYAWWGHLQQQVEYKKWPWSKPSTKWVEIERCWWSKEISNIATLKLNAEKLYDENVEMLRRITNTAMNL